MTPKSNSTCCVSSRHDTTRHAVYSPCILAQVKVMTCYVALVGHTARHARHDKRDRRDSHDTIRHLTGKAGDHNHRRLQRDHPPVPAVISGFAKGERGLDFRIRSQPANPLQPVTYSFLTSVFSDHGFELASHKNNDNIVTISKAP